VFGLFIALSMSITAFPVLARILTDRGIQRSRLGVIALGCAAVDDVSAWCLLAFVAAMARSRSYEALWRIGLVLAYVAFMLVVVRPLVTRAVRAHEKHVSQAMIVVALLGLLASALTTEYIGIHAVFGAFLMGALIPHDSLLAETLKHKLEDLVLIILLPAFFAVTGLRTQISLVSGTLYWTICAVVIAVACLGKFGGSFIAARLSGLAWRESAALGILMNTRGLMELIVLNVGLDLRVISPALFAIMVLMALVTTVMTAPLLQLFARDQAAA
jgi:Kef-type K+ transport system membrane component KefB